MSGGGGGNQGETRYMWNPSIESQWAADDGSGILSQARWLSQKPYERYSNDPNSRVAALDPLQQDAIWNIGDWGQNYARNGGTRETANARNMVNSTLNGEFVNPYSRGDPSVPLDRQPGGGNPYITAQTNVPKQNQSAQVKAAANQYAGMDNPYYNSVLQKGTKDITDAYKKGTAADTQKMMNMAGVFGGGANQQAVADNEKVLGDTLSNYVAGMGNQQYDRSANLTEADIGRGLNAQQFNVGQGASDYENFANRAMAGSQADINRGFTGYENMVNRDLGAQQFNQNLSTNSWEQERGRQMGAINQATGMDDAYTRAMQTMMGAGDANRSYNQSLLDFGYNNWQQEQEYPWTQLQRRAGIVTQAQGGINPNSIQSGGYSPTISPLAGLLGAAGVYGAFNK